jgi:hypothetical protein
VACPSTHEYISAGFWPRKRRLRPGALFLRGPAPEGLSEAVLSGQSSFDDNLGEFILNCDAARQSPKSRSGGSKCS